MTFLQAIILGFVQGATEFLPVSSSGHLVIAQTLFGLTNDNLAFDILLHLGTFFAIIAAYHNSVFNLIKEFFLMLFDLIRLKGLQLDKSKYRYYIVYIIIATIPATIVGVLFDDYISAAFSSIYLVSFTLFITGIILFFGEKLGKNNQGTIEKLGPGRSFIIGLFQMVAITPGISRSGTTMTGGLFCGLKKEEALEFSFLMALPAILGSVILNISDIKGLMDTALLPIIAGTVTAFIVGYLSIKLFNLIVKKGSLLYFSAYCWAVSFLLIVNIARF